MSLRKHFALFALSVSLTSACQPAAQEDTGERQQGIGPYILPNGKTEYYQSTLLGQIPIRGIRYNLGWKLMDKNSDSAASIDSITYGRQPVTALSSSAGWFYVTTATMNSTQIDGSIAINLHIGFPHYGTIEIKKSSYSDPNSGQRYVANYLPDAGGTHMLCPELIMPATLEQQAQYVNHPLIPIPGAKWNLDTGARTADSSVITLACGQDPLGACVQWGYEPWGTYSTTCGSQFCLQGSLASHHQACARMKRADFCGDGRSFTWTPDPLVQFKNVFIQMWDSANINPMLPQTRGTMEANWTSAGASCVNMSELRVSTMNDGNGHTFDAATSCAAPIPACSTTTPSWQLGSARPCTQINWITGLCTAN